MMQCLQKVEIACNYPENPEGTRIKGGGWESERQRCDLSINVNRKLNQNKL